MRSPCIYGGCNDWRRKLCPYCPSVAWGLVQRGCLLLEHLSLVYVTGSWPPRDLLDLRPLLPRCSLPRGLLSFALTVEQPTLETTVTMHLTDEGKVFEPASSLDTPESQAVETLITRFLQRLDGGLLQTKSGRVRSLPSGAPSVREASELTTLLIATHVDIWGEGRGLLNDPKPALVSGPTRSRSGANLSAIGVYRPPKRLRGSDFPPY